MKDMNKVMLVGRLGADPVQRETNAGVAVSRFSLATSRRVREGGGNGSLQDNSDKNGFSYETQWHRIVAWGKQAEACAQYLRKGQAVFVEGSIRSHKYDNKNGEQRTAFEIYAENVIFFSSRQKQERSAISSQHNDGDYEPASVSVSEPQTSAMDVVH
ncbi:MAG: single-stranded DNA-binding protein [Bdellovibrionota bacterium]